MPGIDRVDVHEGERPVVLEYAEARNIAADDPAEDALGIQRHSRRSLIAGAAERPWAAAALAGTQNTNNAR
jgi:hypothetical protein